MLKEISTCVKPANKAGRYVFLGLIGTALILVGAIFFGAPYTGVIWTVALVFITAAIYVYNRHIASEYCYELRVDGGVESLVISMRVGKTVRTLARLELYALTEVRRLNGKEYRKYKCEKGVYKYSYFPTMLPESVYLVSVRSEYESADLFIEVGEEFANAIKESIN